MGRVVIIEGAAADIEAARDFYDDQELGVGDYCVNCLTADLERLETLHGFHAKQFGFHRMLSERFPFAIYYLETSSERRFLRSSI